MFRVLGIYNFALIFFTQNDNRHNTKGQRFSSESVGQTTPKWILAPLSQYYMQIANCRSDQSCSSLVFDHSLKNAFQSNILHYERSVYYSRKYEIGLLSLSKILLSRLSFRDGPFEILTSNRHVGWKPVHSTIIGANTPPGSINTNTTTHLQC